MKDRELMLNLRTKLGFIITQKSETDTLLGRHIFGGGGGSFQTRQRSCVFNSRENCKVVWDHSQSVERQCVSSELSSNARSNCLGTRVNSERQIIHETDSITRSSELALLENEFESQNCLYSRFAIPFYMHMMVRTTQHFAGWISYPIHKSNHSDHGCIHNGAGVTRKIKKALGTWSPLWKLEHITCKCLELEAAFRTVNIFVQVWKTKMFLFVRTIRQRSNT